MVSSVSVRPSVSASHHEIWGGPIKTKLHVNSKVDTPTNIGYTATSNSAATVRK